jgi:hypothetical protein
MSGGPLDQFIRRFVPGKTPGIQAIVVASILVVGLAYPVFNVKDTRQGHDLFSQEKPEAIAQGQDKSRKEYLEKKAARENQQQQ